MIYFHNDFTKRGYKDYHVKRLLKEKKLFYIKKGVYSTTEEIDYLEYILKKHPNAVISLWTACYCYGFLKENKKPYAIATRQKDRKINDPLIKQTFMTTELHDLGQNILKFNGLQVKTFDIERLLIEIVRNKVNIEYDTYREIIASYKKISRLLNKRKLESYLPHFKDKKIQERIIHEIFEEKKIDK